MRTIRITQFYRGVVLAPEDGEPDGTFLLYDVLPHNDAYDKAAKLKFSVNSATHALEVRNVSVIDQLVEIIEPEDADSATVVSKVFAHVSDDEMTYLGIDEQVLRAARTVTELEQLTALGSFLPEDQFEALHHLALGFTVDEVYQDVVIPRRAEAGGASGEGEISLEQAIISTPSRIKVLTSSAELREALEEPLVAWKVFLHPSQRRVAYHPQYNGSAQVSGGPGTGKTVVALHRVQHLLNRYPQHRVLLTTFTNAMADNLRENLETLIGQADQLERVEVSTINRLAMAQLRRHTGKQPQLLSESESHQDWKRVRKDLNLPWTEQFLAQEYQNVVLAQKIEDEATYQVAARPGRGAGVRRNSAQRTEIWSAIERYLAELSAKGRKTHNAACDEAADLVRSGIVELNFDHVVVDEAQDLHPAQWRFLRAAVAEGPDDLFITGDPHQRIYDSQTSLASVGIKVTGRSRRLKVNYRSTEEILSWSTGLLTGSPISDLSGQGDDSLSGYRSLLHGNPPVVTGHKTQAAEVEALVSQVEDWLEQGIDSTEIAVCSRLRKPLLDKVAGALDKAGILTVKVDDHPGPDDEGIRLATTHAMKGLEFRAVAVVGAGASVFPYAPGITAAEVDQVQHDNDLLRDRCLLFVACTRAREYLAVSWNGAESRFVTPLLKKA